MLQIVTRQFFREGIPVRSTPQRRVLYTNCLFLDRRTIELPVGDLTPATGAELPGAVLATVMEHLEAEELDGSSAMLVATSGDELLDDLADVLSFALDALFTRNVDLAERLVPPRIGDSPRTSATRLFRRTFEAGRYVSDDELADLRAFMDRLLAMRRREYELVMRAMRRMVRAQRRAIDDPTLAYVDLVAALESLGDVVVAPGFPWRDFDGRKRKIIDAALKGLDETDADRIREAVIEADRAGAIRRFLAFVFANVTPAYYREDAVGTRLPPRALELRRALKIAYEIRSRNVHSLVDLPDEVVALSEGADTVRPAGHELMLTLEGLSRLARHVIRIYVERAPTGTEEFDWRSAIPGRLMMQLAPEYWLWQGAGFYVDTAERYFVGLVEHLLPIRYQRASGVPDMREVLERIEVSISGLQPGRAREAMLGTYWLWHRVMVPDVHRPNSEAVVHQSEDELAGPSVVSFAVRLIAGPDPSWDAEQWSALASARAQDRLQRDHLKLPPAFDAALQATAAEHLYRARDVAGGIGAAARAVEELPGDERLTSWERSINAGQIADLDIQVLVFGEPPVTEGQEPPASSDD
jgi:hypothetical protein